MAGRTSTRVAHNTAKLRALAALARDPDRWWTVEDWSRAARIVPKRRMYTYALRLAGYDLVEGGSLNGYLVYRIRPEGLKRLKWLQVTVTTEPENPVLRIGSGLNVG